MCDSEGRQLILRDSEYGNLEHDTLSLSNLSKSVTFRNQVLLHTILF